MQKRNDAKAKKIFDAIEGSKGFYKCPVAPAVRSVMNIPFTMATPELEKEFLKACDKRGLMQLKGHRSVGGIRASVYNAMPDEGVDALVSLMKARSLAFATRGAPAACAYSYEKSAGRNGHDSSRSRTAWESRAALGDTRCTDLLLARECRSSTRVTEARFEERRRHAMQCCRARDACGRATGHLSDCSG